MDELKAALEKVAGRKIFDAELDDENCEREFDGEKMYEQAKRVLETLGHRRYPGKFTNVNQLKLISAMCMVTLKDSEGKGTYPTNLVLDEHPDEVIKLTMLNFMQAGYYEEGLKQGLKARKLLDYVNDSSKKLVDYFRAIVEYCEGPREH